jgi:hypothetical protein
VGGIGPDRRPQRRIFRAQGNGDGGQASWWPESNRGPERDSPREETPTREANGVTGAAGGSELERGPEVPDVAGKSLEGAVRIISDAGFVVAAIKTRAGQGAPETAIRTGPSRRPCKTGGAYDPHDGQRVDRSLIKSPRRECQRRHLRRAECSGW